MVTKTSRSSSASLRSRSARTGRGTVSATRRSSTGSMSRSEAGRLGAEARWGKPSASRTTARRTSAGRTTAGRATISRTTAGRTTTSRTASRPASRSASQTWGQPARSSRSAASQWGYSNEEGFGRGQTTQRRGYANQGYNDQEYSNQSNRNAGRNANYGNQDYINQGYGNDQRQRSFGRIANEYEDSDMGYNRSFSNEGPSSRYGRNNGVNRPASRNATRSNIRNTRGRSGR